MIKPNGQPGQYTYAKHPPFVLTVAFDGARFMLVRQWRYPLGRLLTEFPGGSIDKGESPVDAAKREFEEETGFMAVKWTQIGTLLNPNEAAVFLAEELKPGRGKMDEDGIKEYLLLTQREIDAMIARGELTDSKTLACLLLFERYMSSKI